MNVQVNNLTKVIGKKTIVEDVSLSINAGEVIGLIGPNGAGKTTIMKLICGIMHATSGEILFDGEKLTNYLDGTKFPIGMLIENPTMYSNLSGYNNLRIDAIMKGIKKENIKTVLKKGILEAGLEESKDVKVKKYSLGMKQRLGIAMSLINEPQVIVLDEPINGLDPDGISYVRDLILRLANENKCVIVSSHILSELSQVCSKFYFVNKGKILQEVDSCNAMDGLEAIYNKVINGGV